MSGEGFDPKAFFKLSYGLFVLTARDGEKDNGCIINTAEQLTSEPGRISIAVNKQNYTHDMIMKTRAFNVSVLSEDAPFKVFEHFGFQSGRNVNKFEGCTEEKRAANGILYIPKYTNAFFSGKVIDSYDYGTHTLFVAEVTQAQVLSSEKSVTYAYYFDNIKPKPQPKAVRGWVCRICGYVYEGETLPSDFICPVCKHGAADFEPITADMTINQEKKTDKGESKMKRYECPICGYVYDEEKGMPDKGIAAGTKFEDLPEDWECPICGAPKSSFKEV